MRLLQGRSNIVWRCLARSRRSTAACACTASDVTRARVAPARPPRALQRLARCGGALALAPVPCRRGHALLQRAPGALLRQHGVGRAAGGDRRVHGSGVGRGEGVRQLREGGAGGGLEHRRSRSRRKAVGCCCCCCCCSLAVTAPGATTVGAPRRRRQGPTPRLCAAGCMAKAGTGLDLRAGPGRGRVRPRARVERDEMWGTSAGAGGSCRVLESLHAPSIGALVRAATASGAIARAPRRAARSSSSLAWASRASRLAPGSPGVANSSVQYDPSWARAAAPCRRDSAAAGSPVLGPIPSQSGPASARAVGDRDRAPCHRLWPRPRRPCARRLCCRKDGGFCRCAMALPLALGPPAARSPRALRAREPRPRCRRGPPRSPPRSPPPPPPPPPGPPKTAAAVEWAAAAEEAAGGG